MEKMIFRCKGVSKAFGHFRLEDVGFSLEAGCILGVIGRNGSGKTTLLETLMGIQAPTGQAEISIGEDGLFSAPAAYKEKIGFVLNETPFCKNRNAITNGKQFGAYYPGFHQKKYEARLEEYGILDKPGARESVRQMKKNLRTLEHLSQGEQIRQQLAFALSYQPTVCFMDEPTGNLDVAFRDGFYTTIRELVAKETCSVIYASHLVEEMEHFADYILWLREKDGVSRVYYYGTQDDLLERYRMVEAQESVLAQIPEALIVGEKRQTYHNEVLVYAGETLPAAVEKWTRYASLKEIIYYVEKYTEG